MPTVVRPELELARAMRDTACAGVRDHVLGGAVLAAEWRTMPAGPFRGRPVDANKGDETSDQFVHLPPTPHPSSALSGSCAIRQTEKTTMPEYESDDALHLCIRGHPEGARWAGRRSLSHCGVPRVPMRHPWAAQA